MAMALQQHKSMVQTASGLDILAGIWLLLSPFILGFAGEPAALWNNVIFGLIVAILAGSRVTGEGYKTTWPSWVSFVIGLWLLIAPYMLGYAFIPAALWNSIILGLVIAVLALWSALSSPTTTDTRM